MALHVELTMVAGQAGQKIAGIDVFVALACRATAVLAKAFKMKVVALRRNTTLSEADKGIVVGAAAHATAYVNVQWSMGSCCSD
jgi:hypothetical protein